MKRECLVSGCSNKYYAKKYCKRHYDLNRRNGSPLIVKKEMHGMRQTAEYRSWAHLKERCETTSCKRYNDYGGRGIKVCDRWLNSFSNFFEDMGKKPSPKHSIQRIDNNGNYEPSNCKWATPAEQSVGRRVLVSTLAVYPGVRWNKYIDKWQVYFRNKYVGVFLDKDEAIEVKKKIEQEYLLTIA